MKSQSVDHSIVKLAQEVAEITREIISGRLKPYDPHIQEMATNLFVQLPPVDEFSTSLLVATQDCLVNILSCDDAPWDTSLEGFREGLEQLENLLGELRGED